MICSRLALMLSCFNNPSNKGKENIISLIISDKERLDFKEDSFLAILKGSLSKKVLFFMELYISSSLYS